ncbi:phosphonate-transporting ATPase [Candidatus Magnetoovum chiemensis]|nr:phosphonate-transporting ATPase [Candidatus Magnetoovum chiemensis]
MSLCKLENVSKVYNVGDITVNALSDINLTINYGDFIAIMGTSGSGKSTLMNIIGCLDVPSSGSFIFKDQEVSKMSADELSNVRNFALGFVFQHFYLLPYATALENVLLPTLYNRRRNSSFKNHNTNKRQHINYKERAMEILTMLGLKERANFKPKQLSGGQQQRAAIARALINDPEIIICDEPTGQLDSATAKDIMNVLSQLNANKNKTILIVTHDVNIAAYASKTLRISDGKIAEMT